MRMSQPRFMFNDKALDIFPFDKHPIPIRVKGIPVDMNNDAITDILSQYGEVIDVKDCRSHIANCRFLNGIPNGDKFIILNVKKDIPRFIDYRRLRLLCMHNGQPPTCNYCRQIGHLPDTCPKLLCSLCDLRGHHSRKCPTLINCNSCDSVHPHGQCTDNFGNQEQRQSVFFQ